MSHYTCSVMVGISLIWLTIKKCAHQYVSTNIRWGSKSMFNNHLYFCPVKSQPFPMPSNALPDRLQRSKHCQQTNILMSMSSDLRAVCVCVFSVQNQLWLAELLCLQVFQFAHVLIASQATYQNKHLAAHVILKVLEAAKQEGADSCHTGYLWNNITVPP